MKVSVFGLFRDSETILKDSLKRLDDLNQVNDVDVEFFFYENDSKDNTREILNEWTNDRNAKLFYEDLGSPRFGSVTNNERIVLLSYYRNKLKSLAGSLDSDYVLLVDTDTLFDNDHFIMLLEEMKWNKQFAMVTANTRQLEIADVLYNETSDSYYDVFACKDIYGNDCLYFSNCPLILENDRRNWNQGIPVEVSSAFGGFAVVSTMAFNYSKWSTTGKSEHVNFCKEISRFGQIVIVPKCTPTAVIDMSVVNMDIVNNSGRNQIKYIKHIQGIYDLSYAGILDIQTTEQVLS
jgi:hypothetical protein